jgi:hypothetical protein
MGAFFTNIHLRTELRPRIEEAWLSYWCARDERSWAWLSPPYGGWTTLFDWRCDQFSPEVLAELAEHMSRSVECPALAFQVFDSDLAEYWLYLGGREMDHYASDGRFASAFARRTDDAQDGGVYDGFGPDSLPNTYPSDEDASTGGNPSMLVSVTGAKIEAMELEAILRTPAYVAEDILTALASAVGINDIWAGVGYHYLVTEGDVILGREQFRHLPPDAAPNAARPARFDKDA